MNRFKIIWGLISSKQNIFLYEFTRSLIIFIFKLLIIFIVMFSIYSFAKDKIKKKFILNTNTLVEAINFSKDKLKNLEPDQKKQIEMSLDNLFLEICKINKKFYFCIKDKSD